LADPPNIVRLAAVQFEQRPFASFDEFVARVDYFTGVAADYGADFVTFPEMFTLALLAREPRRLNGAEAIERLTEYAPTFVAAMSEIAVRRSINLIAGSHFTRRAGGAVRNVAYVCLRDGGVHEQEKIHPTPSEREVWNVTGGDVIDAIPTERGPIGVLTCYDAEFPEIGRKLADSGARLVFTPFCTDTREGYLRVRYCSHARAIENQWYAVLAGNVGNVPNVENMDVQFSQSCILTPSDFTFAREGVAALASENIETVIVADVDLAKLDSARTHGTVRTLADRRTDLYRIDWRK